MQSVASQTADPGFAGSIPVQSHTVMEIYHEIIFTVMPLIKEGLMLWLFVGPTGVYLLDFFCFGIQFNLLLSPYPCFISLLYLDLYVLGDDALIS